MSLAAALSPAERRALHRLADLGGCDPEDLAAHMVAAYLRLAIDAPRALPDRPLLGVVRRAKTTSRKGVRLA